jgi:RHS repeat-associated protein
LSYTYDYNNRLKNADDASSFVEYLCDASGARIGRIHNSITNYFVVDYADGLKRPLAETDASGTISRYYVWSGMRLLCHIEADGTTRYYHSDELGSTLALTDETGSLAAEFAYMPYGHATANYLTPNTSNLTPFLWLGGYGVYYDSATDLHLTLHRAYSSKLKRFISPDPLGIDGGVNVYMWANMNPLWFVDPYGLCAESYWEEGPSWWDKLDYERDYFVYRLKLAAEMPMLQIMDLLGFDVQYPDTTRDGFAEWQIAEYEEWLKNGKVTAGTPPMILGNVKFPKGSAQLAKQLGVAEKGVHSVKSEILKQSGQYLDDLGGIKNPDIGWTESGQIVLKNVQTGKTVITDLFLDWFN